MPTEEPSMPAIHGSATQLVAVNHTELAVERRGPDAGPAVLLIHGGGEDASMLAAQAASLADAGYHVSATTGGAPGGPGGTPGPAAAPASTPTTPPPCSSTSAWPR